MAGQARRRSRYIDPGVILDAGITLGLLMMTAWVLWDAYKIAAGP